MKLMKFALVCNILISANKLCKLALKPKIFRRVHKVVGKLCHS